MTICRIRGFTTLPPGEHELTTLAVRNRMCNQGRGHSNTQRLFALTIFELLTNILGLASDANFPVLFRSDREILP